MNRKYKLNEEINILMAEVLKEDLCQSEQGNSVEDFNAADIPLDSELVLS